MKNQLKTIFNYFKKRFKPKREFSPLKNLWLQAKKDQKFQFDLKQSGEKMYKPSAFWDDDSKLIFSYVYYGYLVGKGNFKREQFETNYKSEIKLKK